MSDRNYLDCKDDYLSCGDDYLSCKDDYLSCVDEPSVPTPPVVTPPNPVPPVVIKPDPVVVEPHKPRKDDDFIYEAFFKALVAAHYLIDKIKRFFRKR